VQLLINEAIGAAAPNHDMNTDGAVDVVDVQRVIEAVLHQSCVY